MRDTCLIRLEIAFQLIDRRLPCEILATYCRCRRNDRPAPGVRAWRKYSPGERCGVPNPNVGGRCRSPVSNPTIASTNFPKCQSNDERCMVTWTRGFLLVPISGVTKTSQLFHVLYSRCGAVLDVPVMMFRARPNPPLVLRLPAQEEPLLSRSHCRRTQWSGDDGDVCQCHLSWERQCII